MSDDLAPAPEAPPRPKPHEDDRMEAPGVATRRLLLWAAGVFAMGFASAAVLWGAYTWRVASTPTPTPHAFPAPQLETNQTPRATVSTSHGPGPYRPVPAEIRTGDLPNASDPLNAAMQAEAARGAVAYDPIRSGASS